MFTPALYYLLHQILHKAVISLAVTINESGNRFDVSRVIGKSIRAQEVVSSSCEKEIVVKNKATTSKLNV